VACSYCLPLALPLALAGCAEAPIVVPQVSREPAMYRSLAAGGAVVAVLPAVHIGILVAAETLIRANQALAIFVVGLAVAEMACGVWLIQRQQIGDARRASPLAPVLAGA
jgi:hypothetical protein